MIRYIWLPPAPNQCTLAIGCAWALYSFWNPCLFLRSETVAFALPLSICRRASAAEPAAASAAGLLLSFYRSTKVTSHNWCLAGGRAHQGVSFVGAALMSPTAWRDPTWRDTFQAFLLINTAHFAITTLFS